MQTKFSLIMNEAQQTGTPNGVALVPLTRGMFAIVDEWDLAFVSCFSWRAWKPGKGHGNCWYAITGRHAVQSMHQLIMGANRFLRLDHRNGNGLDNRRSNLRIATHSQNIQNQPKITHFKGRPPSSKYKGVRHLDNRYVAAIRLKVDGSDKPSRRFILGRFIDECDAARAYDAAANKHFGEFARLNFPNEVGVQVGAELHRFVRGRSARH